MEEFGSYLKSLRKEKNITLKMLSKELNVGVPFLSLIEMAKSLFQLVMQIKYQ